MTINLSGTITEKAKENAMFILNTIEHYLEGLIKDGILISDIQHDIQEDLVKIFVKGQLRASFFFETYTIEKDGKFYLNTDCTQKNY